MKTVLVATNRLSIGGAEQIAVSQANVLHEAGYNVYLGMLYRVKGQDQLYDGVRLPSDHILHFDMKGMKDISGLGRVYASLKKYKVEIAVCHLFEANTIVRLAAWTAGVKTIIACEHSVYGGKHWWQRTVDRALASRSHAIMAASKSVVDFTAMQENIPLEKFYVVPQISEFSLTGRFQRNELRTKLGIQQDAIVAITIGRMVAEKAQDQIIDLADRLRAETKLVFMIVGYGREEQNLKEKVWRLGLSNQVKVVVDARYAKEYLIAADIFVMTSERESVPIAMLEGMYQGLTPVAYAVGGIPDVIADGENGYLIERNDIEAMTRRISSLVHDDDTRQKLAVAARKSAAAYDTGKATFLDLIKKLSVSQEA